MKKSLKTNKVYQLSFFLSLSESSTYAVSMSDVGAYFSIDSIFMPPLLPQDEELPYQPQITGNDSGRLLKDTAKWTQLTFQYKAKGDEKYLTIGNFNNNKNTNYKIVNSSIQYKLPYKDSISYYYMDDVSLYEITPQDIAVIEIKSNLSACYDSVKVKITNSGDSALNFVKHPFTLNLVVKQNGIVVQSLQKTIQDNQENPLAGQDLAVDSSFWVYFSGISYPSPTGNYTIEVSSLMAGDGDSTNNFLDTTFYRDVSVGNVLISDNSVCIGDSLQLHSKNVKGIAEWQISSNKQDWQTIGTENTLSYSPKESGFFRLAVCEIFSDTLSLKVKPLPSSINQEFQFCNPEQQLLQLDSNDSISNLNWYKTLKGDNIFHQGFNYTTTINESITYFLESIKDGCISKERGMLKITIGGCTLEIPNVFTPNGDGINDVFKFHNAHGKTIYTKIFDRWGNKVAAFENNIGWDGKGAAAGTYYYVIETAGKTYKGAVVLIR